MKKVSFQSLDKTYRTPAKNLACDEALLDFCEQNNPGNILRFWEPTSYFVVLGYANQVKEEVHLSYCESHQIPVLRRCTGGGTILQGPGCLNYSLILKITNELELKNITSTNHFILSRIKDSLEPLVHQEIQLKGHTDLTIDNLKFSGNAQRRKLNYLLFHGTFLLDFDINKIGKTLKLPPKQPDYRDNRTHKDFLMNLHIPAKSIKLGLQKKWNATDLFNCIPEDITESLLKARYSQSDWNFKY